MITHEEIRKISKLARLSFTDQEITNFTKDIGNIMKMIDQLQEVDCTDVKPLTSVCDEIQRLREDKVETQNILDLFSDQTGLAKDTKCFIVPKVVE